MGVDVRSAREAADDALLDDVGAMLRARDPVPPHVTDAARDLFTWRSVDAALAELLRGDAPAARPGPR
jgi:hypothetical protein